MKKLFLAITIIALGFSANSQNGKFNVGVNSGLPIGDADDAYILSFGVEANYLFEISDVFEIGPSLSFNYFLGDNEILGFEVDVEDAMFLPIAAAARFNANDKLVFGGDLGYAVGISPSGNDGGIYYKPMVGFNVSEKVMLQAFYSGVSNDGYVFANAGVGVMFAL